MPFANWAKNTVKFPGKFCTYVHGKNLAKEIESKPQQPSDERSSRLTALLNELVGEFVFSLIFTLLLKADCFNILLPSLDKHLPGHIFPKVDDPAGAIKRKGWGICIDHGPGSLVTREQLVKKVIGMPPTSKSQTGSKISKQSAF